MNTDTQHAFTLTLGAPSIDSDGHKTTRGILYKYDSTGHVESRLTDVILWNDNFQTINSMSSVVSNLVPTGESWYLSYFAPDYHGRLFGRGA